VNTAYRGRRGFRPTFIRLHLWIDAFHRGPAQLSLASIAAGSDALLLSLPRLSRSPAKSALPLPPPPPSSRRFTGHTFAIPASPPGSKLRFCFLHLGPSAGGRMLLIMYRHQLSVRLRLGGAVQVFPDHHQKITSVAIVIGGLFCVPSARQRGVAPFAGRGMGSGAIFSALSGDVPRPFGLTMAGRLTHRRLRSGKPAQKVSFLFLRPRSLVASRSRFCRCNYLVFSASV